jgi:hypothetical protein
MGEPKDTLKTQEMASTPIDSFAGRVHVEWAPSAPVTLLGQLPFFTEFLKISDLFNPWVNDCPVQYRSPNAPSNRDVLGTVLLSVLAGHKRYAHISNVRCDGVNPGLLGMSKVVSEDAVRRFMKGIEEYAGISWLAKHLEHCYEPLLWEPWILDGDASVKPLYGHQEGAVLGYNPKKPGRPSHVYHSYLMANTRLILDVEVQAGNKSATSYSTPGLWKLLERIPRGCWPRFFRGDSGWGTDPFMSQAEEKGLPYLVKLRLTKNVRRLIEKTFRRADWVNAGQRWEGVQEELQLKGWSTKRRVIVLRRALIGDIAISQQNEEQLDLGFIETTNTAKRYEYAVLSTTLTDEIQAIAQHYRDRGDCENHFDELKNQWGWGGYTTADLKRCGLMARIVALIYNWWSLFVRLARPDKHLEAITSRPLLLHAVAKQIEHGGQTKVSITSTHAKAEKIQRVLKGLTNFFQSLRSTAEQLTQADRWRLILSRAFHYFLKGRLLSPPFLLPQGG